MKNTCIVIVCPSICKVAIDCIILEFVFVDVIVVKQFKLRYLIALFLGMTFIIEVRRIVGIALNLLCKSVGNRKYTVSKIICYFKFASNTCVKSYSFFVLKTNLYALTIVIKGVLTI